MNKLILLAVLGLFSTATIAELDSDMLYKFQSLKTPLADGKIARTANNNKSAIESLFGEWTISYVTDKTYTETINLDSVESDTEPGFYGVDSTNGFVCFYDASFPTAPYDCYKEISAATSTTPEKYAYYYFKTNGDTLSGGYCSEANSACDSKDYVKLTGTRASVVVEPTYDDFKRELIVPSIKAFGTKYRVVFTRATDDTFKIKTADEVK